MELTFAPQHNFARIKLTGTLTKEAILRAFDASVGHPCYHKGMARLWDFSEADLSGLDSETIGEMAQYSTKFPPGINDVKVAFLTGLDLEYALSRMFSGLSMAKTPISVFRSFDEAVKWLVD